MIKFRDNPNASSLRKAFTLIEMMVVISILMILIGLVIAVSRYVMVESARKKTVAVEAIIVNALQVYYDDNKAYPANNNLYDSLKSDPKSLDRLRVLPKDVVDDGGKTFKDAWNQSLRYDSTGGLGGGPVIISNGPDQQQDTTDDIRSDSAK